MHVFSQKLLLFIRRCALSHRVQLNIKKVLYNGLSICLFSYGRLAYIRIFISKELIQQNKCLTYEFNYFL